VLAAFAVLGLVAGNNAIPLAGLIGFILCALIGFAMETRRDVRALRRTDKPEDEG